ncbi:cytochrome PufQ [Tateyamaria sp. Alg231-49]|uniref:cytochrome PufQ n=1 Tax=Tateyamaria sp. Alg231-49 TaxID=1922219 RepID=UPI000D554AF6|nr:cytochrome PufQ [Tateyamaria sp. Alg231-49]
MTDFNNDINNMRDAKRQRQITREYQVYFGLIFLAAVPSCTAIWAYGLVRHAKMPAQGPIQSAIGEARTITPCIFWA